MTCRCGKVGFRTHSPAMRPLLIFGFLLVQFGCAAHSIHPPPVPSPPESTALESGFLDLQAGWRVLVVTPILKSGGYRLQPAQASSNGNFSNLQAGSDFVGYENAYYAVTKNGIGIRVEFRSAEAVRDGKTIPETHPLVEIFNAPSNIRYLRLIYLLRVSQSDHNMALVGADEPGMLSQMTQLVQARPDDACRQELHSYCSWVAPGIAVRPEEQKIISGKKQWVPAR